LHKATDREAKALGNVNEQCIIHIHKDCREVERTRMFKQRKPHPKDKSFALGGFSRGIMYIKFLVLYYKVMK
jgi:hypothetical protein